MIFNMKYWISVSKNLLYIIAILVGLCIALKLSIFYMPFLVAFIISLLIEPLIKYIMKKTKLTRKTSAIIIFIIVSILIISIITWIIITLISEASNLLNSINIYFDKSMELFRNLSANLNLDKINISEQLLDVFNNSSQNIISNISKWIQDILHQILDIVASIPTIGICIGISIVALYFISVDRIYILDQIEHHFPKRWVKKFTIHLKELIITLSNYIKAEATLILISFIISLIGLYALEFAGFNIGFPLLIALTIGFVDALPILGSGTIMIPWAFIRALNGDINLAISIIILLLIMSIVRQCLEPKLISKHIGIHPIFTLIAMYTGFKILGVIGLIIGPIILIILKNIFATFIDGGIVKTIFDAK